MRTLNGLKREMTEMRASIESIFEKQNQELTDLKSTVNLMSERLNRMDDDREGTVSKMSALQAENRRLKSDVNRIEQSLLETSIGVQGISVPAEDELQPVINTLLSRIDCNELTKEIVGITRNPHAKRQEITIKFATKAARDRVLTSKKRVGEIRAEELNCQGERIYMNEKLTTYNGHLLWLAKTTKPQGYKYVWTRNGKIYMRKEEGAKSIVIRDVDDIPCR
jgi:nitrate/nitrite-specific signal transduction histidine kinase